MNLEQAKHICVEAHKGQWRRPVNLDHDKYFYQLKDYPEYQELGYFVAKDTGFRIELLDGGWSMSEPYSSHPIAVAGLLTTDEEKILGYLHDVVEDCKGWELTTNYSNKYYWLCSPEGTEYELKYDLYIGLKWLTHRPNEPYLDYINMIAEQPDKSIVKVKIADITHNLSCGPSQRQKEKYLKAMKILLASI